MYKFQISTGKLFSREEFLSTYRDDDSAHSVWERMLDVGNVEDRAETERKLEFIYRKNLHQQWEEHFNTMLMWGVDDTKILKP